MERQLHVVRSTLPPGTDPDREEAFNAEPDMSKLVARCNEMITKEAVHAKLKRWLDERETKVNWEVRGPAVGKGFELHFGGCDVLARRARAEAFKRLRSADGQ